MDEERVEYYGITDPPGVTIPDELKPYMVELLRLQKEVQKYRWVSVKDRLPEKSGYYLVWYSFGEINICYYDKTNGWWTYDNDTLSHWMPLPEPPGEVEE